MTLLYRAKKRGIETEVVEINSRRDTLPQGINLIFGGGGQDKQQEYVSEELQFFSEELKQLIFRKNVPGLAICGTYQLFGHFFKTFDNHEIKGISVFDLITVASTKRKIGNVVVKINKQIYADMKTDQHKFTDMLVGFENHSGNTILNSKFQIKSSKQKLNSEKVEPLGTIIKGFGNNGEDGMEGAITNNCIGTYLHGPILPKNPGLADWLIQKAISAGTSHGLSLQPIDDSLELQTHEKVLTKILNYR